MTPPPNANRIVIAVVICETEAGAHAVGDLLGAELVRIEQARGAAVGLQAGAVVVVDDGTLYGHMAHGVVGVVRSMVRSAQEPPVLNEHARKLRQSVRGSMKAGGN